MKKHKQGKHTRTVYLQNIREHEHTHTQTLCSHLYGTRFHRGREQEAGSARYPVFGDTRATPAGLRDGFSSSVRRGYEAAFGSRHGDVPSDQ
jgi:hypothetical protein